MSCMDGSNVNEEEKSRHHIISANAVAGYNNGYPNHLETHPHNFGPTGPNIYNGMDHHNHHHMVGFPPSKNDNIINGGGGGPVSWKRTTFFDRPASSSNHEFMSSYQHDFSGNQILHEGEDDDVRSSCVFPCEGNERPSHGLSLSLNSANPSAIGLQSFELRQSQQQQQQQQPGDDYIRFGPSGFIRGSRYLVPTQELLSEFCNLGIGRNRDDDNKMKGVERNSDGWQESEDAIKRQSLYSLDLLDLQRRKTKLLQMLEEVDRRYKHYRDQMRSVVASFESVAGHGAAKAYSALASKAMSRHFRSLKDGISCQIKATRKAMGEKDCSAPGTVKGETPRLRVLDQTLRQQRALQQMGNMEIHPWRPQRGLPERSVSVLRAWLFEHFLHPYPSDVDKHILARQTGLSRSQVSNWFINARVRLWKPMVEEMYLEELKEEEHLQPPNDDGAAAFSVDESDAPTPNSDQKPTHDQLLRIESECFSSIMNNNNNNNNNQDRNDVVVGMGNQNPTAAVAAAYGGIGDHSFGGSAMEFDFSSYGSHSTGGGGVSLTLGLHQHGGGGGGMNLPFSAAVGQGTMFSGGGGMEDNCEAVQYSMMDGEGGQNLPYRNLMGAQLLHDFAG